MHKRVLKTTSTMPASTSYSATTKAADFSGRSSQCGCVARRRFAAGRGASTRCNYEPGVDRQPRSTVPAAPPLRVPPPPPPPPPPGSEMNLKMGISKRMVLGLMFGGGLVWSLALRAGMPQVGYDARTGVALLRTAGGNLVAATRDEAGNIFMYDKNGNIYYDTGAEQGIYIVDSSGDMFNTWADTRGEVQRAYVGNIRDLREFSVKEIGGVPVEQLAEGIEGLRDGRMTAFVKKADRRYEPDYLPKNAPAIVSRGGKFAPPEVLEDSVIELERKGGLFGGGGGNDVSMADLVRSLKIEK